MNKEKTVALAWRSIYSIMYSFDVKRCLVSRRNFQKKVFANIYIIIYDYNIYIQYMRKVLDSISLSNVSHTALEHENLDHNF